MIRIIHSKALIGAAVIALVTAMPAIVSAQGPNLNLGGLGRLGFPALALLDLTEQQRAQVGGVTRRHRADMRQLSERMRDAFDAQRDAIETFPVDEDLVRSTSQALSTVQTDMALLQAQIHSEIWLVLTPEQQAQAKKMLNSRKAPRNRSPLD